MSIGDKPSDPNAVRWQPGRQAPQQSQKTAATTKVSEAFGKSTVPGDHATGATKTPSSSRARQSKESSTSQKVHDTAKKSPVMPTRFNSYTPLDAKVPNYKQLLEGLSQEIKGTFLLRESCDIALANHYLTIMNLADPASHGSETTPPVDSRLKEELKAIEYENNSRARDFIDFVIRDTTDKPEKMHQAIDNGNLQVVENWLEGILRR